MEEIDLMELFEYFKSKILWIIAAVILAIGVGNVVTVLTRVPMYNSNTTIVLVSENSTTYNTTEQQLNKNLVSTYAEIIKSRKVLCTDKLFFESFYKSPRTDSQIISFTF